MPEPCNARVFPPGSPWASNFPCSRKGKVFEENKWWCTQHSPTKKAERRQQREEQDAERTMKRRERNTKETYDRAAGTYCRSLGLTLEALATNAEPGP